MGRKNFAGVFEGKGFGTFSHVFGTRERKSWGELAFGNRTGGEMKMTKRVGLFLNNINGFRTLDNRGQKKPTKKGEERSTRERLRPKNKKERVYVHEPKKKPSKKMQRKKNNSNTLVAEKKKTEQWKGEA